MGMGPQVLATTAIASAMVGRGLRYHMACLMGSVSLLFSVGASDMYALIAWLPQMLTTTAGVSAATARVMISIYDSMGFPHSLLVPIVTRWYEANPRHNGRKSRFCPNPGSYLRWRTERATGES
jgi:cyanate permease